MTKIGHSALGAAAVAVVAVNAACPPVAPMTEALVALETSSHEAWKSKDAAFGDPFFSDDTVGFGTSGRLDKAEGLMDWTGPGCDVKSVGVTHAAGTRLSPTVGIPTIRGWSDGTCSGRKVGSS